MGKLVRGASREDVTASGGSEGIRVGREARRDCL